MSFIAGTYTATWNGQALGQSAEGWASTHQIMAQAVQGDSYGRTDQDDVLQGAGCGVEFTLIEANQTGVALLKWPLSATAYTIGAVGRLAVGSSIAKPLVLTAIAGTPAAASPATATFTLTMLAPDYPVRILYGPALRDIPIRMKAYPYAGVFAVET